MKYDLIIVTRSSSKNLINMTRNCIRSARQDRCDLKVIIVETNISLHEYEEADKIIQYEGPFNYNKALNMGLSEAKGDIHILANNDIIFYPGWSVIGEYMKVNGFDSASALSNDPRQAGLQRGDWIYEGYTIGLHLTGWCIFVTPECIRRIGGLNESFEFWYSDNIYADQLQAAGVRHGLFCNVQVDHITSMTLRTMPNSVIRHYSYRAVSRYRSMRKQYAIGQANNKDD